MQLELGTHVRSRDHKDVGRIKYLILDPIGKTIKTVVVEKGLWLPDDIEVPIENLQQVDEHHAEVSYTADQITKLERFDEGRYTAAPDEHATLYPWLPTGGLLWPTAYPSGAFVPGMYPPVLPIATTEEADAAQNNETERERHPQRGEWVITTGDDVITADGEKVGEVHNVIFDAATGKPITLVVSEGFMFTHHVELPATTIANVTEGIVYLNVTKEQLKTAPREPGVAFF